MKTFKNPSVLSIAKCASCTTGQPLLIPGVFFMQNQNEVWKDVIGYEGSYKVSNYGNVKSVERVTKKNKSGNRKITGKTLSKIECTNGYLSFRLSKNGVAKMTLAHRIVAIVFIENTHNKPMVNHKDGNKKNNHISNLEWVTRSENAIHAIRNGLMSHPVLYGENNGMYKKRISKQLCII